MLKMISRLVLRYHRWIGLLAALPLMVWGLSGLSHPVMSRLQPQPAAMMPPTEMLGGFSREQLAVVLPLSEILPGHGIDRISRARLLNWQGEAVWQVTLPGKAERLYLRASDGALLPGMDEKVAVALARHYVGDQARAIASVQRITQFSSDYQYVNRLLPVWRVEFAGGDHLRAFVETSPLRLATLDNDGKALFGMLFRTLHSWAFIRDETLRDSVMTLFLVAALLSSLGGLWMYGFYWRQPESGERTAPSRRWHRRLGLAVAITTLTFTGSAILHLQLLDKGSNEQPPVALDQSLPASALTRAPGALALQEKEQIEILPLEGLAMVRLSLPPPSMVGKTGNTAMPSSDEHNHKHEHAGAAARKQTAGERYISMQDGAVLVSGPERQARHLGAAFAGLPAKEIISVERVTKFEGEYGFVNKRLPVWKVSFDTPDHLALYVESGTGIKAAEVHEHQRFEGFVFAYLHKWVFLDGMGKNGRDFLAGLFAFLNVLVALLGLVLWSRRVRLSRRQV